MKLYKFKSSIRSFILNHEVTYKLWFYSFRSLKGRRLPNAKDHFYFDGYPRSGNTYFVGYLKRVFSDLRFTSHLHSTIALKIALKLKIPTFILIRSPEDAVSSNLYRVLAGSSRLATHEEIDGIIDDLIDDKITEYIRYYQLVKNNLEVLNVTTFRSCIVNEVGVAQKISEIVRGHPNNKGRLEGILQEHKRDMKLKEKKKNSSVSSLPNEERNRFKKEYKIKIKKSKHFSEAKMLYENLNTLDFSAVE